jgi:hypothetical protein
MHTTTVSERSDRVDRPTGGTDLNARNPSTGDREVSRRQAAKIAGLAYVGLFVLGMFANFFVLEGLIESGDATATASNIRESEGLFRAGLVGFLVIFALDVVVAWALHLIFRPLNRDLSLLAAWFRLAYTTLLGVATVFLFLALDQVSGADYLTAFDPAQLDAQAMSYLDAFATTWVIGLLLFGVHLVLLGSMVLTSGTISRALGYLLVLAGAGYVVDTLAHALLGNYQDYETLLLLVVAVPAVIGEFAFTLWLLFRAGEDSVVAEVTT